MHGFRDEVDTAIEEDRVGVKDFEGEQDREHLGEHTHHMRSCLKPTPWRDATGETERESRESEREREDKDNEDWNAKGKGELLAKEEETEDEDGRIAEGGMGLGSPRRSVCHGQRSRR